MALKVKSFPTINTKAQIILWNKIYLNGGVELMTQRERRTAFSLQKIIGSENIKIKSMESNDEIEYIFFSEDFKNKIGANRFDMIHKFIS
jgi:hypothetical protein